VNIELKKQSEEAGKSETVFQRRMKERKKVEERMNK